MATKFNTHQHHLNQKLDQAEDEGNTAGTYFAITAMLVLLALVAIYFWVDNGHQVLQSADRSARGASDPA